MGALRRPLTDWNTFFILALEMVFLGEHPLARRCQTKEIAFSYLALPCRSTTYEFLARWPRRENKNQNPNHDEEEKGQENGRGSVESAQTPR